MYALKIELFCFNTIFEFFFCIFMQNSSLHCTTTYKAEANLFYNVLKIQLINGVEICKFIYVTNIQLLNQPVNYIGTFCFNIQTNSFLHFVYFLFNVIETVGLIEYCIQDCLLLSNIIIYIVHNIIKHIWFFIDLNLL